MILGLIIAALLTWLRPLERNSGSFLLCCRRLLRRGHWIQRYRMTAMLKKNVRHSSTVTSCIEHLSSGGCGPSASWRPRVSACPPAWGRSSARHGFLRNSEDPAFMARTLLGVAPCPVLAII